MAYTSVTLSSVGNSAAANLNWLGSRPVTFQVLTNSSVGVGDFTIQYTLSDLQRVASSLVSWSGLSSAPFTTPPTSGAAAIHFTSSTIFPDGILITYPGLLAAVRLNSTALSSNTLTLNLLQGEGG